MASWKELADLLRQVRNENFRSDVERSAEILETLESIVQEMLEKLHKANV